MQTEIGIVCNRPADRQKLVELRQWIKANEPELGKCGRTACANPLGPLNEALSWRSELPDDRLVVTVGFKREEIDANRFLRRGLGEPLILCEPDAANARDLATASFLNSPEIVTCRNIFPFVEKGHIRSSLRKQIQIRPPQSDAEWAGYFSLRYRVWEERNFLRDENKCARTKWEVDWKDRAAIPLCAITPAGKVVGCARVLKSHGQEEQPYISQIANLLQENGDAMLLKLFSFPHSPKPPFDLLMEFPGFGAHYQALLKNNKEPAEISRVAVDPEYRGRHIAEVLVDTAVALAEARHFSPILLACSEELVPLYAKCGFAPVKGLKSSKYLNIQLPSTVMERQEH